MGGVKDEKFDHYKGSLKNLIFRGRGGGSPKNQYIVGNHLKRGAWTVWRFKGGFAKKEEGGVFEQGWYPNAHYDRIFIDL